MLKKVKGFTLVEVIIALIIILIVSSALGYKFLRQIHQGYQQTVEQTVANIAQAIQDYYEDTGKYPSRLLDLEQSSDPHWAGAYINYKLTGSNEIDLAGGRIKISYYSNFSGDTDCGYLSNRPAIVVLGGANKYNKISVQGVCKATRGRDLYFVIP
jgi:prepilin-type N-terminal cleavage/methylation domain-containing protein